MTAPVHGLDLTTKRGPKPGTNSPRQALVTVRTKYPEPIADWLIALAEACDRTSQNDIAKRLNYTSSVISSVINNSYKGSLESVEKKVRGALLSEVLECPVLGELRTDRCLDEQKRARVFCATSAHRVRMYKACRSGCMHSKLQKAGEAC